MRCPKCNSLRSAVTDTRGDDTSIRRRRECQECGFRFSTYERLERNLPMVIKKDGSSESFKSEKIRTGILKACEKRPVSLEAVDQVVEEVERKIQELCLKEVDSQTVGDLIMTALKDLDQVAYVRFASVYREFSDVTEFEDTLKNLKKAALTTRRESAN